MKKLILLSIFTCIIYLTGCGKKEEKTESTGSQNQTTTTTPNTTTAPKTETKTDANKPTEEKKESTEEKKDNLRDKDGAIRVKFPAGATEVTLNGKIKGFGDEVTYVFEVKKGQQLNASVTSSDKNANIRISQIITPKDEGDGPFGQKIKYNFDQSGDWKLILSENQMAGDPWKGEFKLTINIK